MPSLHANRGAKRAREARVALRLDPEAPLPCVVTVVEDRAGVPVIVAVLPADVAGACFRAEGRAIVWVNGVQAVTRQRFTVAHEFGHVRLGHDQARLVDTPASLVSGDDPQEVEANAFAAEFLTPRSAVRELVPSEPSLEAVLRLAQTYGLSGVAALVRCRSAGVVSAARAAQLQRELDDGDAATLLAYLDVEPVDDLLLRLTPDELPWLSPAVRGSALAAALGGEVTVDAAADAAGTDASVLGPAVADLSR